jgi:hypothetical protein
MMMKMMKDEWYRSSVWILLVCAYPLLLVGLRMPTTFTAFRDKSITSARCVSAANAACRNIDTLKKVVFWLLISSQFLI